MHTARAAHDALHATYDKLFNWIVQPLTCTAHALSLYSHRLVLHTAITPPGAAHGNYPSPLGWGPPPIRLAWRICNGRRIDAALYQMSSSSVLCQWHMQCARLATEGASRQTGGVMAVRSTRWCHPPEWSAGSRQIYRPASDKVPATSSRAVA